MKPVSVDYYTDAIRYTQVRVLEIDEQERIAGPAARANGDVLVRVNGTDVQSLGADTTQRIDKLSTPELRALLVNAERLKETEVAALCTEILDARPRGHAPARRG